MIRLRTILLVLLLVLVLTGSTILPLSTVSRASAAAPRTLILSAFAFKDNAGNWQGESAPFLNLLQKGRDVSDKLPYCSMVWEGEIYNQPVSVVTMGVGKVNSATCMSELLDYYHGYTGIKDVLWSGIAGITPMFGGMLDASGNRRSDETTVIGDVCATFVARDWDLQFSSAAEQAWWLSSSPNSASVALGSQQLSLELYQAGLAAQWPDLPPGPADNTAKYNGEAALRKPTIYPPDRCAEISGDDFWHGTLEDARARELVAAELSKDLGREITPADIVVLTAQEGTGWGVVLDKYAKATGHSIPFAISRSASNFDHPWFTSPTSNVFAVTAEQSISAGFAAGGATFGEITAAIPVLKLLELRGQGHASVNDTGATTQLSKAASLVRSP